MAFPLLFPLLASGGLLLRASPHIFRYLAPKAVTGANRLGQLITKSPVGKFATKNPKFTASMVGGSAIESMMTPEEAHAPSNPYLQNMQNPHGPFMPYTVPRAEMPLGVGNHPPIPEALEDNLQEFKIKVDVPQAQPLAPASQTSPVDTRTGFEKFVESDFYKKLQDLFAGMSAAPSGGSGWDALASGVKRLNEGDKQRGKVNQTVEYLKSKGYSEEEARVMASNPQMLSALLTGGDAPAGFQWYTNPETGEREYRPVKGSMQELEYNQKLQAQKEWEGRRINNMFSTKQQLRAGLNDLKAAFELLKKGSSTGFKGWFTKKIGGSDGYKLDKLLEGIRGSVLKTVFENLKSMSSSGAVGTGPISNFESQALSSMFGSLDVGRNKEGLERTLQVIETAFNFFNKHNDLVLYNALTGQALDTPQEISDQYFVDSPMSQGARANLPILSSREDIKKLAIGHTARVQHGNDVFEIIRKR
ncbi:hypothetical protein MNL13_03280 [Bartonella krasnovii]|uniref:Oligopeptide ABC transporter, periplasmic oligopeptide-binding protein OppA n=1 Tax=Bartonella krasnovii TaxID=2267275 RepID=A0A5B9D1X9_9HYPH|nr:hypothetical protein [Bartonella krasnovii]QEE12269.1 oligopeptide ABC transporter, periplasmic oligopeptide-binding protein OppA [Bartonella krasnovii]UNF29793.1 hypothetical protein MNL13_03280 [Bartonella krasnovii]UNF36153.1 hypothetical protein MNL12_03275 [Bartonella krasnovii]UNF49398.1 hypothetical protein MNL04_03580 [Bartonella krasnovii]UNF52756.1 hypothetical protein MNL02_03600 [Bartonella krasnovii]